MSLTSDIFGAAPLDIAMEYHGETVTFLPRHGAARTVTAARSDVRNRMPSSDRYQERELDHITLLFRNDDTTGITDVSLGDAIEIDGRTYGFESIIERTPATLVARWVASVVTRDRLDK